MAPRRNHVPWLSSKQGYELTCVGGLPQEVQRLIWLDVTRNYYLRGSVIDRAASVLQMAWRRLRAIINLPVQWLRVTDGSLPGHWRWFLYETRREAYPHKYPSRNPEHYDIDMWDSLRFRLPRGPMEESDD